MAQQAAYAGTGRRKNSVARVRLVPGNGKITVNKEDVTEYIPYPNSVSYTHLTLPTICSV